MILADSVLSDALSGVLVALAGVLTTMIPIAGLALRQWLLKRAAAESERASADMVAAASARVYQALALVTGAATQGATAAWGEYTKARKAAAEDGKLTPEEAAEARRRAKEAALRSLGAEGRAFVTHALGGDGLDAVLEQHLASQYAAMQKTSDGAAPVAPTAPASPP